MSRRGRGARSTIALRAADAAFERGDEAHEGAGLGRGAADHALSRLRKLGGGSCASPGDSPFAEASMLAFGSR